MFFFISRKRYERTIKDIQDDFNRLQRELYCLQGNHKWGTARSVLDNKLYIRCDCCYTPAPKTQCES